uniref:Mitochondrial potassium channel ATP-binding subunit n=1 Tax=Plectus sambesii TaxID=2011161 RepID=A0A914UQN7_9BILA
MLLARCVATARTAGLSSWLRQPVTIKLLVRRPTKLVGVTLSLVAAPLIRQVQCKKAPIADVSKRAQHLAEVYANEKEPTLSWADLWQLLKPYLAWLMGAVISAVGVALLNIRLPILLGELVNVMADFVNNSGQLDTAALTPVAVKLISCYGGQAILTFAYITFLSVLGERMATDLRQMLFSRLLHQDMAFYDAQRTGELSARLSNDVQEFKSSFKLCVAQGLRTIAQTGGCVVSLYLISPKMTLVTLSTLPLLIAAGSIMGSLLRALSRKAQAQNAIAQSIAEEAFANIRTVRSFAMEDSEERLFEREVRKAQQLNEILGVGIGIFQGATNFVLNGIVLGVLYGGSKMILTQEITAGDLMSFLVTAQTIQRSLGQLSVVFGQAVKGWTAGARVFEFIHLQPTIPLKGGKRIPHHALLGTIKFDNVCFTYPTRPGQVVLEDLNLDVAPGTVVALCGPSGGGKSTIAALLERFYEPNSGQISIDGHDIRTLDPEWLRGQAIGLISQEPVLFATTIAENIRYGRSDATDEEVREAARLANAHEFVTGFPQGYNTVVGERGVTLSGGQKQRVAIARALLKNPPILILDEATSALDAESERLVRDALDRAVQGRTVLVIAHRLSTIQNSDQIMIIKGKRVAEAGTHKQLLKKKGLYWDLVQSQTALD